MKRRIDIRYNKGIYLTYKYKKICFDLRGIPTQTPDLIIFSHLHRDHFNYRIVKRFRNVKIVMSKVSKDILNKIYRVDYSNIVGVEENNEYEFLGLHFKFTSSGHCAGSVQIQILDDIDIVYTGDINIDTRIILRPPPILKSDILIIESTYGHPSYIFPKRIEIYRKLLEDVKKKVEKDRYVVIGARPLGTSQELTALFSYSKIKGKVFVHPKIYEFNRIHEENYEPLGNYFQSGIRNKLEGTIIKPLNIVLRNSNYNRLICTGWSIDWRKGYPLSNHSDFASLVRYVKDSHAEKIYTVYGFANIFAEYLKSRYGLDASPLRKD